MQVLDQGCTLITPTARLGRYFRHHYARLQLRAGRNAWPTPDILPWHGWLQRTWEDVALRQGLEQVVLGPHQQEHVWREIINRSTPGKYLLQPAAAAREAMSTWTLCREWQLPLETEAFTHNEDARAFRHWSAAYRKRCADRGWMDEGDLAAALGGQAQQAAAVIRTPVLTLAGFDAWTPAQRALLDALQAAGVEVRELAVTPVNERVTLTALHDSRGEIQAAARWARQLLEVDPDVGIGVIVPNLHTLHVSLQNMFDDVFFPGAILAGAADPQRPYAIALGRPLPGYPLIDTALLILNLGMQAVPLADLGALLRSPFIGGSAAESAKRARLDAALRRHGEPHVSFDNVQWLLANEYLKEQEIPEQFLDGWRELRARVRAQERKQKAGGWARLYAELLQLMRWPGERALTSAEYQTVAEWQEQLRRFATLDLVVPALSAPEALRWLRQLLQSTSFQPETEEAPIQILGVTGAAAMQFDHLWFMGMHEEAWPGRADPNPFIPLSLQRAAAIPGATPETTLAQVQELTRRLISSAPRVQLSYPRTENERDLRGSPLLRDYAETIAPQSHTSLGEYPRVIYQARALEEVEDATAPALAGGTRVGGGTSLLKDQAACPFRACARHRLHAQGLDTRDFGLDAKVRGILMHDLLEKLWDRLAGSQALLEMSPAQVDATIDECVGAAVEEQRRQFPQTCGTRFVQLETGRLRFLIHEALELERARPPFTVRAREHWHRVECNGISLRTRIDRIDELADGRIIIMDYKTGMAKIKQWFSDRPDDPQLPLYAINAEGELAALAFVRVQKDNVGYLGLAREHDLLPGVNTVADLRNNDNIADWEALLAGWRLTLERLAGDFRQGIATVDPKNSESCRNCDLHALCRIHERDSSYELQDTRYEMRDTEDE